MTQLGEKQSVFKRFFEVVNGRNFVCQLLKLAKEGKIALCLNVHYLVCAECGDNREFVALFLDFFKGGQVVEHLICCKHVGYV